MTGAGTLYAVSAFGSAVPFHRNATRLVPSPTQTTPRAPPNHMGEPRRGLVGPLA